VRQFPHCPKCKSNNTYLVPRNSLIGRIVGKFGFSSPTPGIRFGPHYLICRNCGHKTIVMMN
jgi:hypothetical protein